MSDLDARARELLASARVAHLATADQYSRPHVVPIVFAIQGDVLYFPLDRKPKREDDWHMLRRVRNIETNGRVSIVIDHYEEDWAKLAWVLLEGVATILETDAERDAAANALAQKYPQYQGGALDGRPVVRVVIERAVTWRAGQEAEP
ncbi:MAG: TIGR03668 family PPOX class F420-dependent oxidoreductase [Chloroflexota bacterium]